MADGKEEREQDQARLREAEKRAAEDRKKIPWNRQGDRYEQEPQYRGEPERGGS